MLLQGTIGKHLLEVDKASDNYNGKTCLAVYERYKKRN